MWELVSNIGHWIIQPAMHYSVGFAAGALGSLLTSIICYALYKWASPSSQSEIFTVAKFGMIMLVVLVGVSAGLLSHAWLDSFSTWLSTPLNPPMTIIY